MSFELFAHRGLNTLAPENTLAAFRKAADHGVRWLETDVDVLGDGTPILCHDTLLDRTTNRSGNYYDLSAADLPLIDAGSWFAPEFAGEGLPTLRELVDFLNESGMNANIELKSNEAGKDLSWQLIRNVATELERLRPEIKIIISSFNHVLLALFKQHAPQWPVACLWEKHTLYPDWRSIVELVGAEYVHPEDTGLTRQQVQDFRAAGLGVNVWTVNSRARAHELKNWGATGVFTDVAHTFLDLGE